MPNITDIIKPTVDEKFYYRADKYMYKDLIKHITSKDTFYQWRRVYVRENKNNICPTLPANRGTGGHNVPLILTNDGVRKLVPTEVERLQGFPDGWTEGLSDTQRYKTLGNAVTTNVVTVLINDMFKNTKYERIFFMDQQEKWTWVKGTLREQNRLISLIMNHLNVIDPEDEAPYMEEEEKNQKKKEENLNW